MRESTGRRPLVLLLLAVLFLGAVAWAVFVLGHALPPRRIVMTTGTEEAPTVFWAKSTEASSRCPGFASSFGALSATSRTEAPARSPFGLSRSGSSPAG
jgi:uncharacterized membrane protein YecN with MAPEG domain